MCFVLLGAKVMLSALTCGREVTFIDIYRTNSVYVSKVC